MLCPARFIVDATENSKEGGVAAKVCSPDWVINKIKRKQIIAHWWVTKMKSLSWGNLWTLSKK